MTEHRDRDVNYVFTVLTIMGISEDETKNDYIPLTAVMMFDRSYNLEWREEYGYKVKVKSGDREYPELVGVNKISEAEETLRSIERMINVSMSNKDLPFWERVISGEVIEIKRDYHEETIISYEGPESLFNVMLKGGCKYIYVRENKVLRDEDYCLFMFLRSYRFHTVQDRIRRGAEELNGPYWVIHPEVLISTQQKIREKQGEKALSWKESFSRSLMYVETYENMTFENKYPSRESRKILWSEHNHKTIQAKEEEI